MINATQRVNGVRNLSGIVSKPWQGFICGILMTLLRSEVQSFLFPCFLDPYQTQRSVRSHFNLLQKSFALAKPTVSLNSCEVGMCDLLGQFIKRKIGCKNDSSHI